MLAPQQTIMRASAILRCEGAAAKLDFIWILNTLPFRGLRCANMQRKPEAKHCSSLCSQSEGDEYCGGQTRLKIQRRYALKRWLYSLRVRGPHFASKVSYNAGAATDDCAGQRKSPQRGRCCQYLIFYLELPPYKGYRQEKETTRSRLCYLLAAAVRAIRGRE